MTEIKKKTSREHILERPSMYIGASNLLDSEEYILKDNKVQKANIQYIPGLIKIINEVIDNSVDIAIKTNFKGSNLVDVKMTSDFVEVKDNGPGIPVSKQDNEYLPFICWGYSMSGSNFDNDSNRTQMGMNGLGAYCTNVWSKKFIGISDDGKNRYQVTFKDNAKTFKEQVSNTVSKGCTVKFYPDLERFGLTMIDETHKAIIFQRLLNLSISFPEITFKFNGKTIKTKNFKAYAEMFSETFEVFQNLDFNFAIMPSSTDEFQAFSYLNGLYIKDSGTHVDVIVNNIISLVRESLCKKYKNLKPADIKNKLMFVGVFRNFPNPKFNSQTKEKLTNSNAEVNQYLGDIDYQGIAKKILKNKAIIDPIVEVFKIKEELKNRQELKSLNKVKKIKDEHYLPSNKTMDILFIVEGQSALNGISPALGRDGFGYYCLRGKPLNVWNVSQSKFTANKELSTLYKIIKNENYHQVVYASDQDLDGFHIRALLSGFVRKYLPEYLDKVGMLETPIIGYLKSGKIQRWSYELSDTDKPKQGETPFYYKGLSSWEKEDLKKVIKTDGVEKMIKKLDFTSEQCDNALEEWLGDDSEPRKKHILENDFNIADI